MAPRIKTSERIVQNSLDLFNQQGERSVSTNHIAAHMDISPGNLYYHFPNKQAIIAVLFAEYEALVDSFLRPPQGRASTIDDKRFYLKALLAAMWRYRFLHRDLEHLLESDAELAARYRRFSQRCLIQGQAIYAGFVEAGILGMDAVQTEALTLNAWIVLTSWVRFLSTTRENAHYLSEESIKRGVYQVLVLESGFVTAQSRAAVDKLLNEFYVPLAQALEDVSGPMPIM
ncbi:TetR/AcrR family transcriptional regulator [Pseudomonas gingeri]|uniref:TetR/AcrR family transcriptional regulator n=1 Tax=Pseudomonas gingeri TaxID=117681 RepID=A0A7Y7XGF2_9PSED|nr:TetR/AcrR family transcriptional regulator [Pseudomonas gingeri]NWA29413.1 TetR/AcrR family transcriptional regulator [Pseudomonas gingeri]NWB99365.1 TetR/AcrR family transcriptional regulator [Pseudomonas gingeri]NWD72137.1 TetR/AcrR family transcriptional regulator [Pseudomonas gingeri]NWD73991.1 TetR/AcrR family transcriptional regulator [Pseudomonas gingeri]